METCRETCGGVYCRGIFRNEQIFGCWAEDSPYPPSRESLRNSLLWQVCPQKTKNCQFTLKFGIQTNSNRQISMVMFTFSVFHQKYLFWANFVQRIKIVTLSWNLLPRLIRIWTVHWWWWRFLFSNENTLFEQIWVKKPKFPV